MKIKEWFTGRWYDKFIELAENELLPTKRSDLAENNDRDKCV